MTVGGDDTPGSSWAAVVALTVCGYALTVYALYPGYMTNDATYVYGYIKDWSFGDWQSPLMSIVWWLIDPIAPGPGSMFLLIVTLYWLGFGLTAVAVVRHMRWPGIVVPFLGLTPPAFMMLAMIWRDILFAALWLVAAAVAYLVATWPVRMRWPMQALALGCICLGVLLRPNAIVAAPFIAAFALLPSRFDWKRTALLFIPLFASGYALVHVVYYDVLNVERQNPLHSIMVFDLGGITHFTGENQFPAEWTADEMRLLTSTCYDPERWDSYWTIEPCRFVMARLERKDDIIFGTPRLTQAWLKAITAHPLAYLHHRLDYLETFLGGDILTLELYSLKDQPAVASNSRFGFVLALFGALKATMVFRVGLWLALAAAAGVLAWGGRATPSGAFSISVTLSAVAYVLSFALVGVAAEFRYAYWCVLASLVGMTAALVSRHERRQDTAITFERN